MHQKTLKSILRNSVKHFQKCSQQVMRTLEGPTLITMDIDTGDSPPLAQKPYTLPLKHYDWVQQEIESLE